MLIDHKENIGEFIAEDPKGKLLPEYYTKVGEALTEERDKLESESDNLLKNIKMIIGVIERQREYAKGEFLSEEIDLLSIIEDALMVQKSYFLKHRININKNYPDKNDITILAQRSKLIYIFSNILKNANEAMRDNQPGDRIITIEVEEDKDKVTVNISDNGEGISKENLTKVFSQGFHTKEGGQGIALHTCANYMNEMGGDIFAESSGRGKGATFKLIFPYDKKQLTVNG